MDKLKLMFEYNDKCELGSEILVRGNPNIFYLLQVNAIRELNCYDLTDEEFMGIISDEQYLMN